MGNERLRGRMHHAGLTALDLASAVEVDPKTVDRWLANGRVPLQRHRRAVAKVLGTDEARLWPELLDDERARAISRAEVRTVYPNRGAVPPDLWRRLINESTEQVDVLVYAGLFLVDNHPQLPTSLAERAADGLQARLLFGDPQSEVVIARGVEEGIRDNLAARIQLSLSYLEPAIARKGVEVRLHGTVLYNSLYRFDDELLVNTHVIGAPAAQNPVLHVQRLDGGQLFDHYLRSFERVWASATPLEDRHGPVTT